MEFTDNFDLFDNFAFVHSLARVILTRPRNVKNYYANILKQFMKVMQVLLFVLFLKFLK